MNNSGSGPKLFSFLIYDNRPRVYINVKFRGNMLFDGELFKKIRANILFIEGGVKERL